MDKKDNEQRVSGGKNKVTERLVISGFGGQGIMALGKFITLCAMREKKYVTFIPAYGAEVRGGTSYCAVIISDKEIASPQCETIDTLIAMNEPAAIKFLPCLRKGADIFLNASMAEKPRRLNGLRLHYIHFTNIAGRLGNARVANMVALGAYIARKKILSVKNIIRILPEIFKQNTKLIHINEQALQEGLKTK